MEKTSITRLAEGLTRNNRGFQAREILRDSPSSAG